MPCFLAILLAVISIAQAQVGQPGFGSLPRFLSLSLGWVHRLPEEIVVREQSISSKKAVPPAFMLVPFHDRPQIGFPDLGRAGAAIQRVFPIIDRQ